MADETVQEPATAEGHYVYLYSDKRDKVRYVGYGQRSSRATSHIQSTHNPELVAICIELHHLPP